MGVSLELSFGIADGKSLAKARHLQLRFKARAQAGVPVLQKRKASLEARRNDMQNKYTRMVMYSSNGKCEKAPLLQEADSEGWAT
jgi:hypothetical protein